jgi:hypothetical protein
MAQSQTIEVLVAVHVNNPAHRSVRVSIDGVDATAVWIGRNLISSIGETGQHTRGKDRFGDDAYLPLANLVIPEWLAKKEGFI